MGAGSVRWNKEHRFPLVYLIGFHKGCDMT